MKVMMVAGDPSGDINGAALAKVLRERHPGIRMWGMGGSRMREAGVRLLFNLSALSSVGVVEALRNYPVLKRLLVRLGEILDSHRPDVLVLIDFPGFNLKLAELAKAKGVPVVFYFSPSAWAWGKGRAQQVAKLAARVCTVLPQEDEVYREAGAQVTYVGHPLLDLVKVTESPEAFRQRWNLQDAHPLVALLPGSREQEIRYLLPLMLRAARSLKRELPKARFAVAVAHSFSTDHLQRLAAAAGEGPREEGAAEGQRAAGSTPGGEDPREEAWPLWIEGETYNLLAAADLGWVASGTATLEAALLGTPIITVYKVAPPTYALGKMLVKIPHISMPNIIAGREVVPELLQTEASPSRLVEETLSLWRDPTRREAMRQAYGEIRQRLGGPGAIERAAAVVLEVGGGQ